MPGSEYGFQAAIGDVVTGLFISIFMAIIAENVITAWWFVPLIQLMILIATIQMIDSIEHWSLVYLIGYTIGYVIMVSLIGSIDWSDVLVIAICLIFTSIKAARRLSDW